MAARNPEITIDTHDPTGAAQVSVSVWLTEEEHKGLLTRIFSQQTVLHDGDQVLSALQLVDHNAQKRSNSDVESQQAAGKTNWELSLVQ